MDRQTPPPPDTAHRPVSRRKSLVGSVIAVLVLALLGGLAWYLVQQSNSPQGAGPGGRRGPPPTTVGIATVEQQDIPVIVEALGTVTASAVATVRPQVSGVLQQVHFTEGQMVRSGQLLATIDPRQFEIALMQATGQRQRDEAQLENARVTLARYKTLLEQDSIARQEVDSQAALVKQLEGTVAMDRAAESTARLNLSYTRITAPITGRVGLRTVDVGNLVSSSDANGIADITQVSPIDVEFALPQDLVPALRARLEEGAELRVEALDRGRIDVLDTGKFLALDNQVDPQTGTVKAKARFTNARSALFPSQFVNARLLLRTIEGALVVPVNAVRHGGSGDYVYVVDTEERKVALRPVRRGQATADRVQILSGLQPGEKVVTEGADRLKDGASVTLPGENRGQGAPRADGKGAGGEARGERRRAQAAPQ
ncbi:efflux RND transporter periplasmic adaptor subunit [Noviherbaspirillum aridicola]|nr:efflux RND transporter periplasmic adaptor subunit [Noviherbaspirillum aridicola]